MENREDSQEPPLPRADRRRRKLVFGLDGCPSNHSASRSPGPPQRLWLGSPAGRGSAQPSIQPLPRRRRRLPRTDSALGPRQEWPRASAPRRSRTFVSWLPVIVGPLRRGGGQHSIFQEGRCSGSCVRVENAKLCCAGLRIGISQGDRGSGLITLGRPGHLTLTSILWRATGVSPGPQRFPPR